MGIIEKQLHVLVSMVTFRISCLFCMYELRVALAQSLPIALAIFACCCVSHMTCEDDS